MSSFSTFGKLKALALGVCLVAGPSVSGAEEITIGFTAALSGDFAAFGLNQRKGLDLAIEELSKAGRWNFKVVSLDDRGEPKEGVLIAQRMCDNPDIKIVMGYSFSSVALAAVPILDECKLPVLASGVGSEELSNSSPYFRRNLITDAVQGSLMGEYAVKDMGYKNIYILYQQDDYGLGITDSFTKAAEAAGGTIVGSDNYLLGTKDFKTQIAKIRELKPDAVFLGGFYTETAKIALQSRTMGLDVQMLGTDGSLNPELMKLGRDAVEGMVVYGMYDTSIQSPATEKFLAAYRAKFNEDPNAWAALGYDATYTLAEALRIASEKGPIDRVSLNQAFSDIKDYEGVTGPTAFDEAGNRAGSLYYLKVENGKFTPVK